MYHSITFGEKNTWDDWHLIPTSRPVFSPPKPDIRLLNIPGKSGSLDVSELMGGQVVYADRTGSFEFFVDHEYWESWIDAFQTISNYLHGNRMKAVLEDDPTYYYEGRFSVNEWRSSQYRSSIVISYTVGPYKLRTQDIGDAWLWDSFFFGDPANVDDLGDVIESLKEINLTAAGGTFDVTLEGYGYRSIPTIICSDPGVTLTFDSYSPIVLQQGENMPSLVVITVGRHILHFEGTGEISVHYMGGSL